MKRGYHPSMAMGPIMATGGIAMLIPPSTDTTDNRPGKAPAEAPAIETGF